MLIFQECQRLVQKCKTLLAKLSITAPQYASSYGWMSPIAAQLDDIKEVDQSHSPNQSQSIFTGCDNQWLQFMMDSFIRDDNLCEPQTLPADDSLMVFHLSQQTNNNTNPNLSSIIKNSQEPSSEKIPVTPQDQTITSSPCIRLSQPQQLVVLSHSDILTLANHLKLNPSDLTVAIEKLRPKTIQPVEIEYININENQIDLTSNVQRMSSSEGSAVSATPPSQLR